MNFFFSHIKKVHEKKKKFLYLKEYVSSSILLIERTETPFLLYSGSLLVWDPMEQENKA